MSAIISSAGEDNIENTKKKKNSNERISPTLIPIIVNATVWSLDLIWEAGSKKKFSEVCGTCL